MSISPRGSSGRASAASRAERSTRCCDEPGSDAGPRCARKQHGRHTPGRADASRGENRHRYRIENGAEEWEQAQPTANMPTGLDPLRDDEVASRFLGVDGFANGPDLPRGQCAARVYLVDQAGIRLTPEEINHARPSYHHPQDRRIEVGDDEVDSEWFGRQLLDTIQAGLRDLLLRPGKRNLAESARFRYGRSQLRTVDAPHARELKRQRAPDEARERGFKHPLIPGSQFRGVSAPREDSRGMSRQSVRSHLDLDPGSWVAIDGQFQVQRMGALLHAIEPDVTRIVRSGLEADAIIDDPKFDVLAVGYQLHFDRPRRRVLDDILYGFMGNPIERLLGPDVKVGLGVCHEIDRQFVPGGDSRCQSLQPYDQALFSQAFRPQAKDQGSQLG